MTRQLGYRHVDDLCSALGTRRLLDWLAVNDADPFTEDRGDFNAIRLALAVLAPHSKNQPDLEPVFQVPFGRAWIDDTQYEDALTLLRREREKEREQHGG